MTRTPITWDNANFAWDNNPYTWDDIALVQEIADRVQEEVQRRGGMVDDDYVHPLFRDEKKNKRLIKLIYKTQGKVLKEEKEIKEIKVTVKDVKILAKEVLGINVKIL